MECSSKEMDGVEDIFDTAITIAVEAEEEAKEIFNPDRGESRGSANNTGRKSVLSSGGGSSGIKSKKVKRACKVL